MGVSINWGWGCRIFGNAGSWRDCWLLGPRVPGVRIAGVRGGSLCKQLVIKAGGRGGSRRCEMKRSKVLRVQTRELERIRWQLGKGGGEGWEQQRSAERNVLMGRQPERWPGPPLPKAV